MKPITIIIVFLIFTLSIIVGFLSSYDISIIILIMLVLYNLLLFFSKKLKTSSKFLFSSLGIICLLIGFHFGLFARSNFYNVCLSGIPKNEIYSPYNLKPISLDTIEKSFNAYEDFKIDTLKTVQFNEVNYAIKRLSSKKSIGNKTKILIVAGMHGSETANVYAISEILKHIDAENLLEAFNFEILYALNPAGIVLFNRYNESNCDINRDFIQFKTEQSQLLRNRIDNDTFDYVLDLHEGPYDGHYFINNTSIKNLSTNINKSLEKENVKRSPMLKNKLKDFLFQNELDNPLIKMRKIMTFDNYLNSKGIENILSESDGLSNDFDERIHGHVIVFKNLIEAIKP